MTEDSSAELRQHGLGYQPIDTRPPVQATMEERKATGEQKCEMSLLRACEQRQAGKQATTTTTTTTKNPQKKKAVKHNRRNE
jgi:hypothetical protein